MKHLVQHTGLPVPKQDVKIMNKSHITGFGLVRSGTEEGYRGEPEPT